MTDASFLGSWRIVWMSNWDQDYVNMEVPGHFTFGADGSGSFQFGLVQGELDGRIDARRSSPRIDFTWEGSDENDEASGRGHAEIVAGTLQGHLYFHHGDDSAFRAVRQVSGLPARKA